MASRSHVGRWGRGQGENLPFRNRNNRIGSGSPDRKQIRAVRERRRGATGGSRPDGRSCMDRGRGGEGGEGRGEPNGQSGCDARNVNRPSRGIAGQSHQRIEPPTFATHPWVRGSTPGRGRRVSWMETRTKVRIRAIGAHGPADRGGPSRHHSRSSYFARLLRFSCSERQRRGPYRGKKYVYIRE